MRNHTKPYCFKILLVFAILFNHPDVFAQTKNQRIEVFTKVWGFLKYHHPQIATGTINWDSVYVENLPKIENAASNADFNRQLLGIINILGEFKKNQQATLPDGLFSQNHNLDWIVKDKLINAKLKGGLKEIYTYRNQKLNRYIKVGDNRSGDYSGELTYDDMTYPTREYRLLFLARFWNVINYFAPYKYLIGEDWNNILPRFIPKIINTHDTLSYYKTLLQLAKSLNDGHAQLYKNNGNESINNAVFGSYTAPIYVDIIGDKVVVRKVIDTIGNNIKQGDMILSVDNEQCARRIITRGKYISASNINGRNSLLTHVFLNTHSPHQKLKIKRGDKVYTVIVNCILTSKRNWADINNYVIYQPGYKLIGESITYVCAPLIWDKTIDTIKTLIKNSKAVIFDVRNYPTGNDAFYKLISSLLPKPEIISLSLNLLPDNPGYFLWKQDAKLGNDNKNAYKGQVVILVDERSQSQGEYSAMAFQTISNSITIGSKTAGADGVTTLIPIGGGLAIAYSGYGVYYPDKTITQRQGVRIDIPVKKTVQSIVKGEDIILQKALNYLKLKGIE